MRNAQDGRRALPKAAVIQGPEVRSAIAAKVTHGHAAEIHAVLKFPQDGQRALAKAIAPGEIGFRPLAEVSLDLRRQCTQLVFLEFARKVAGIGIVSADSFGKRRIDPWMQVSTYGGGASSQNPAQNTGRSFIRRHR